MSNKTNTTDNLNVEPVNFNDLVVAKKNDKFAIFNKENSTFLTNHEFDRILLSESGHHIVQKADDLIDEDGRLLKHWGKITYSAVIDNHGNIKEFEDIDFGYNGAFIGDICAAFNKKTGKVHLVDYYKGIISEGFVRILPLNRDNQAEIYYGLKRNPSTNDLEFDKFLYRDGSTINVTLDNSSEYWKDCKINEITNIDDLKVLLEKYGADILEFTPLFIFNQLDNFYQILKTINQFHPKQLVYTIKFLDKNIKCLDIIKDKNRNIFLDEPCSEIYTIEQDDEINTYKLNHNCPNFDIDFEINISPKIEADFIRSQIDMLYIKIQSYI